VVIDCDDTLVAEVRHGDAGLRETVRLDLTRLDDVRAKVVELAELILARGDTATEDRCEHCVGACCMKVAPVPISRADVERLEAATARTRGTFADEVSSFLVGVDYRLRFRDEPHAVGGRCCTFLSVAPDGRGRCTVYAERPALCRDYSATECTEFTEWPSP
jgi:Fe-S-cluster containining protein